MFQLSRGGGEEGDRGAASAEGGAWICKREWRGGRERKERGRATGSGSEGVKSGEGMDSRMVDWRCNISKSSFVDEILCVNTFEKSWLWLTSVFLPVCLCLPVYMSIFLDVYLSVFLFTCRLSVCLLNNRRKVLICYMRKETYQWLSSGVNSQLSGSPSSLSLKYTYSSPCLSACVYNSTSLSTIYQYTYVYVYIYISLYLSI